MQRFLLLVGLLVGLLVAPVQAKSLKDGLAAGVDDTFAINRKETIVRFGPEGASTDITGPIAKKWLALFTASPVGVGRIGKKKSIYNFANAKNPRQGVQAIVFELGVIFSDGRKAVVLDWPAVAMWEKAGGFAKKGMPKQDDFKARVRVVKPGNSRVL